MSFLQTLHLFLSLTAALLWPATAYAQTSVDPLKADPTQAQVEQVQIEVDFATLSTADLDKSGMTFDRVPFNQPSTGPTSAGSFLRYATGERTARFLQTLRHTRGDVVRALLIATSSDVAAIIHVSTQVPDWKGGFLFIQGGLTVTPRINRDKSVSLRVALQASGTTGGTPTLGTPLRTIRSGDVIAVDGLPLSPDRPGDDRRLLVFIMPIRLGTDAQEVDARQPDRPLPPLRNAPQTTGKTVSLDVSRGDLRAVVAMLERQANVKTSMAGTDKMYKPVYVHLDGASVSKALRTIAASASAQVVRDGSGVYVFSPLSGTARPSVLPDSTDGTPVVTGGGSVTVTP